MIDVLFSDLMLVKMIIITAWMYNYNKSPIMFHLECNLLWNKQTNVCHSERKRVLLKLILKQVYSVMKLRENI